MVDLIVGCFLLGALYSVFYVGFKAGNKYATVKDAFAALKAGIK